MSAIPAGYKQTEVGVIPSNWAVASVGELARFTSGKGISLAALRSKTSDFSVPVYGGNGIAGYTTTPIVSAACVVVGRVGQRCGEVYLTDGPAWITDNALYPKDTYRLFDAPFLAYALKAAKLNEVKNKNDLPLVTQAILAAVRIAWPAIDEQRAIAAALSDVDALLAKLDLFIAKKRDLKQAAMQQLLTCQTRLPGFSTKWAPMKIRDLCDYVDGQSTAGGDLGYLEIGDINIESKSYDVEMKEKLSVRGAVKVPSGTLLISTVRPTRGAIVVTKSPIYVSSAFCRLRPSNGVLYHLVCQNKFLAYLGENSIGGTYPTCRDETILDFELMLPPDPDEQIAIATILSDMDAELAALEARREKTRALKQGMMQELLTGRVRLT